MKKFLFLLFIMVLASCHSQQKYTDFDYSYARSGGFSPIYENLLIKDNKAFYSFEGRGQKVTQEFKIEQSDILAIENALRTNEFRKIREDRKKLYDNISTSIAVNAGDNSGRKSDDSMIMEQDQNRWDAVVKVFRAIIENNIKP